MSRRLLLIIAVVLAAGWALGQAIPPPPSSDPLVRGARLYEKHCASCHGPEGRGDGPTAAQLNPRPRDFAGNDRHFGTSPAELRHVITHGVPKTAMTGYRPVFDGDLDDLVAYVQSLPSPSGLPTEPMPAALAAALTRAGFRPAEAIQPAARLDLVDAQLGSHVTSGELHGKLVLLYFWGSRHEPSLRSLAQLDTLQQQVGLRKLRVLALCVDERDSLLMVSAARPYAGRLTLTSDPTGMVAMNHDAFVLPTAVLLDRAGRVLGRSEGPFDWSRPALREFFHNVP